MHIEAVHDALHVSVGPAFHAPDVDRFLEGMAVLTPFSSLTIDFGSARDCDDAAIVLLARALATVAADQITLRGLTEHHWRLLTYLGLQPNRAGAEPE